MSIQASITMQSYAISRDDVMGQALRFQAFADSGLGDQQVANIARRVARACRDMHALMGVPTREEDQKWNAGSTSDTGTLVSRALGCGGTSSAMPCSMSGVSASESSPEPAWAGTGDPATV